MCGLKAWAILVFCLGGFVITGCGERDLSKPPKILYGRDICAQCRMIIQDERFACAVVSADQRYLKFDDIGCLTEHEKKQIVRDPRSWVHDAATGGWVVKNEARFVHVRDWVTPMGYGLAAFASAEGAEKFAEKKGGRVITWDEFMEEVK